MADRRFRIHLIAVEGGTEVLEVGPCSRARAEEILQRETVTRTFATGRVHLGTIAELSDEGLGLLAGCRRLLQGAWRLLGGSL